MTGGMRCDSNERTGQSHCLIFAVLAGILSLVFSSSVARAQSYSDVGGLPPFSAPEPVELGFTDAANGNLHLEIPLGSFPQRPNNRPFTAKFVYDSSMLWVQACNGSCVWSTGTVTWRYVSSGGVAAWSAFYCNLSTLCGYTFTDPIGTSRHFFFTSTTCPGSNTYASDSSGYMLEPCGGGGVSPEVFAPDGTIIYNGDTNAYVSEDSNGNMILGPNSSIPNSDTLGRAITSTVCSGGICYNVPNSQGQTSTYKTISTSIPVNTNFGQSGVTEFSGNISVIQSIVLPDGTSYAFKYDCDSSKGNNACGSPSGQSGYYGLLTSMTLPAGGTINYGYTTFTDSYSGKVRWLNSRQAMGGTWSYVPRVISTCTSTQVGCQQSATVTRPSGDSAVYTFTLNNGAWPVKVQSYDSSSSLLATINNTYDFSQPCQYSNCHGAADIRLLTAQTTLPTPAGSITSQTQYVYDSPQTGNIIAKKEWRYYSGTSPTFPSIPDRATYTTYLTTGTNDINRPLSVSVCNNSGTDSACPGGGSRVQQTLYTYDSYSGCPSGLAIVNGIMNHDDTNFGGSYTARGNATQIQQWVAGSTYVTSQMCYDTTGQVTQQTDPKGNVTKYGYADKFYSDNGTNTPTSYTPSQSTNGYATSVTQPIIGTSAAGFYYGSGNFAFTTDPNGVTTYSHYMDLFDRSTESDYAFVGWNKTVYTSSTQGEVYLAVGDTAPSAGCASCQHKQVVLDTWGRRTSEKLLNNSTGTTVSEIDTTYEPDGRIGSVSHPYSGTSDPNHVFETFTYDGLNRQIGVLHPDGQLSQTVYGALVGNLGLTSQLGSTATYGYGFPVLSIDEAGKQKQEWMDGFGRIIEVDEFTALGTIATGSVTISGSERCSGTCDTGTVTITVGSYNATADYGQGSNPTTIANDLVAALSNGSSPVTASSSGGTVSINSKATGTSADYSLSSSARDSSPGTRPSFATSNSGSTLTGGTNPSTQTTLYTYNALDQLTQVVQGVQTRSYVYDGLGRATSVTTPEAGTESLSYTVSSALCSGDPGNVCQKTDARGVITTYFYDALNRIVGKSYTIPSGSNVAAMPNVCTTSTGQSANTCYNYDQGGAGAFALARRTQMVDPSGSETYAYDKGGRISSVAKTIGAKTYTIAYQYNAGDEVTQVTYPSGRVVQQSYTPFGWPCEIAPSTSTCGSSASPFATAYSYDAAGHVLSFNYGNGVASSYSYSPKRSELATVNFAGAGQNLFSLNYWYQQDSTNCPSGNQVGNNGQIQCVVDATPTQITPGAAGRTIGYTYDALGRMSTAKTNGSSQFPQWGLSETYDAYGNRWSQSVTAGTGYASSLSFANPGGAQTNHPDGWCFDASGNLLSETSSTCPPSNPTFVYDGENRMTSDPGAGATYLYDGNGTRVQKCLPNCTNPTSSTVFIFSGSQDIAEYDNGAAPSGPSREFIYSDVIPGAGLLATITGGSTPKTTYFLSDHLDWRVSTDGTSGSPTYGQVNGYQGHYPFGESWYSQSGNEFVLTSYQRDSESGLDYAMARYYDSRAGRFCSADPLGGQLDDPQTWNRYTYARNDPINMHDPSGKGFLSWLIDALLILADIFSEGATTEASIQWGISTEGIQELVTFGVMAKTEQQTTNQGQTQPPQAAPPQGNNQAKRVNCTRDVNFTVVGPHQAPNKSPFNGEKPGLGDAAVDPRYFGFSDYYDLAHQINPRSANVNTKKYPNSRAASKKIQAEQATMNNADITITPVSDTSKMPDPGPYSGTDVYGYPPKKPIPPNSNNVDIYRAKSDKEAGKGTGPGRVVISYNAGTVNGPC
jgi:RHS repeat-associated protein